MSVYADLYAIIKALKFAINYEKDKTMKEKTNTRNYGIDLLRIIAMFYVVLQHSLLKGGVMTTVAENSPNYIICVFMEVVSFCAVDMFAIISGYVCFSESEKPIKASSYIKMWLQVVFYGVLVTAVFGLIYPGTVMAKDYVVMLMPVTNGLYWYFSAYTALFLVMPLLNAAVRGCTQKQLKRLLVILFIGFVCFENITYQFSMGGGYTFAWLMIMYLIGAIMKKCDIGKNIKPWLAIVGIVVLVGISYIWKIRGCEAMILGKAVNKHFLTAYTSPTMVLMAMLYVIGFSKINFPKVIQKIIAFFAPATFAVYLLNNQGLIWSHVIENRFVESAADKVWILMLEVVGFSLAFTIAAMLIDKIRILIFRLCRIDTGVEKLTKGIDHILNKMKL